MTKKEIEKAKELARLYYAQGDSQAVIAEKTGISRVTINKWVSENGWDTIRAAARITRSEVARKMLSRINDRLDDDNWTPDELAKCAAAIEKLDKKTNIVTIIEVFAKFNQWLSSRMALDSELTPQLIQIMTKYQDLFVAESDSKAILND